jgi:kinesin family protein 2/24
LSYSLDSIQFNHEFSFDKIYDGESTNIEIFKNSIEDIVEHTLQGGCGSVVAYGQTGTGKTHSLLAPNSGIIFESIKHLLKRGFKGSISFLEIYLGYVQDCLKNRSKINIFEKDGFIYANDLTVKNFNNFEEAVLILNEGIQHRTTSYTNGNSYSSRSHAVIFIDSYKDDSNKIKNGLRKLATNSTFVLVDLAGSERGTDRQNCTKESQAEGAEINKSLLALKECIRGIEKNHKFLPFRQSKLTQLLKNSFIGESKLFFLATISANGKDVEHTLNTLRYAMRIKESISDEELKTEDQSVKKKGVKTFNSLPSERVKIIKNKADENNPVEADLAKQKYLAESTFLTFDEILRLKNLQPAENSSIIDKINRSIKEISALVESKKDSEKLEKIAIELDKILLKLKNTK